MSRKKKSPAAATLLDSAEAVAKIHQLKVLEPELLGERLRKVRSERKISQRDLTKGLFTSAYLSSVELGKTRPTLYTLEKLAERLGEPVDYFLRPSGKTGSSSNMMGREFYNELSRQLEIKQRLTLAEMALLENRLDRAEQELNTSGDITGFSPSDRIYFYLLQATLHNRQNRGEAALECLSQLSGDVEVSALLEAGSDFLVWFELESGRAYKTQNHYFTALEHFHKGLNEAAATSQWRRELLLETGDTYRLVDEPQKATDCLQQGLDLFSPTNDRETALALYAKAQEQARQGDFQQAAFFLGVGYQIARQARDYAIRLDYTLKTGQLYYTQKKYEQAAKLARTADSLTFTGRGRSGENLDKAQFAALVLLAKSYFQTNETVLAQQYLEQAAQSLEDLPNLEPLEKAAYFETAALICSSPGQAQPEKAAGYYEQAIALLEPLMEDENSRGKIRPQLAEIYYNYSQFLKDLGRVDQTLENLEKAYRLRS